MKHFLFWAFIWQIGFFTMMVGCALVEDPFQPLLKSVAILYGGVGVIAVASYHMVTKDRG